MGIKKIWGLLFIAMFSTGCTMQVSDETKQDMTIKISVEDTEADAVVVEDTELKDLPETDLLYIFTEKSNEDVVACYYGDFDHDDIHEAFVVTGEILSGPVYNMEAIYGKLWLVNSNSIQLAAEDFSGVSTDISIWEFDNKDYLAASKNYITGSLTSLWTVSSGSPQKNSEAGLGDIRNEDGVLHIVETTEDAMIEDGQSKGQTIKYYDMYYDGSFKEYGAILITETKFLEYIGADDIMEKLRTDYPQASFDILFHNNNVIYINITNQIEQVTYQHSAIVDLQNDTAVLREVIEGKYQKALLKEVAVYPIR